jgi:hypothetical protein
MPRVAAVLDDADDVRATAGAGWAAGTVLIELQAVAARIASTGPRNEADRMGSSGQSG